MANRKNLTDLHGEVRPLGESDFHHAQTFDSLPASLQKTLRGRGPQKMPTKERITIRLSREVLDSFRASGTGWQSRIDAALKEWIGKKRA